MSTPGRIVDHLQNTKGFHLRNLKALVLDEADKLLNMDFEKEINLILSVIPKERTTYLFSATMTSKVAKLQRFLNDLGAALHAKGMQLTICVASWSGLISNYTALASTAAGPSA